MSIHQSTSKENNNLNIQNTYLPLLIISGIILSICSISCLSIDDSPEREAAFRKAVDTVYTKKLKVFIVELDSICSNQMDSLVQGNIDSIKQVRLKEIEKLKIINQ